MAAYCGGSNALPLIGRTCSLANGLTGLTTNGSPNCRGRGTNLGGPSRTARRLRCTINRACRFVNNFPKMSYLDRWAIVCRRCSLATCCRKNSPITLICSLDIPPMGISPSSSRSPLYFYAGGREMYSCNPSVSYPWPACGLLSNLVRLWRGGKSAIAHTNHDIQTIIFINPNGLLSCKEGRLLVQICVALLPCCSSY